MMSALRNGWTMNKNDKMVPPAIHNNANTLMKQVDKASSKANLLRLRNEAVKLEQSNNAYTKSLVNYVNNAIKKATHNNNGRSNGSSNSNNTFYNATNAGSNNNNNGQKLSNREMFNVFATMPTQKHNGRPTRNEDLTLWMQGQLLKYAHGKNSKFLNPEPAHLTTLTAMKAAEKNRARRVARTKEALAALDRAFPNSSLGKRQRRAKDWGKKTMSDIFFD